MLSTAVGIFFCTAFVFPMEKRYKEWKASDREIIARRNWRGQYVPDLTLIRCERALKWSVISLFLLGLVALYGIMLA